MLALLASLSWSGCTPPPPVDDPACVDLAWADEDRDGFGGVFLGRVCARGPQEVGNGDDCDDRDPEVRPGAADGCDGIDNDCDLEVDEDAERFSWFPDDDRDRFGDASREVRACSLPGSGFVRIAGDCNDARADVNPAEVEICNGGVDDDCNGFVDDADPGLDPRTTTVGYPDEDRDGFGNWFYGERRCALPPGWVENGDDCDDTNDRSYPGAVEICDERDNDCDGAVDDDDDHVSPGSQIELFCDLDADGFGDPAALCRVCLPTVGIAVLDDSDCDDDDPLATVEQEWLADTDGDGFGGLPARHVQCLNPDDGTVPEALGIDCDDDNATIYPEAREIPGDGIDQDCDGTKD